MSALPYCFIFILPVIYLISLAFESVTIFALPIFIFLVIPVIDHLVGRKPSFYTKQYVADKNTGLSFKGVLYLFAILQTACLVLSLWYIAQNDLDVMTWLSLALSLAMLTGGAGINMAHELNHKREWHHKRLADCLLLMVCYPHFNIQHVYGHHRNIGTPSDPASARKGEWVHTFVFRSMVYTLIEAWQIETKRLSKQGQAWFSFHNKMLNYTLVQCLIFAGLAYLGTELLLFFLAQSFFAVALLEIVNYIEHYGLTRKQDANGQYERVSDKHSWNSAFLISNLLLFNLQLHSEHHENANKWYPNLRVKPESPELPSGYPLMVMVALFTPPLWFRMMDARIP